MHAWHKNQCPLQSWSECTILNFCEDLLNLQIHSFFKNSFIKTQASETSSKKLGWTRTNFLGHALQTLVKSVFLEFLSILKYLDQQLSRAAFFRYGVFFASVKIEIDLISKTLPPPPKKKSFSIDFENYQIDFWENWGVCKIQF